MQRGITKARFEIPIILYERQKYILEKEQIEFKKIKNSLKILYK
jgi:hypothetical protein